ncbi:PAAR domain-containing protein [Chitinimonas sp. PSY-7]|uniref:PAAR domain-containing protein n=1 Tax=Chitinimonas sp. PSY-7 TaxID=3459088 RepID=UPI0040400AC9
MDNFDEQTQQVLATFLTAMQSRPVKATYLAATLGSKTEMGGQVFSATSGITSEGHAVARVGDTVRYPDGTESTITTGNHSQHTVDGKLVAIVGSMTSNGDIVVDSLQTGMAYHVYAEKADAWAGQ